MSDEKPARGPRKPKYILQMSDADSFLPLNVGEMLWRAKVGEPFIIPCDEIDPGKTARLIQSYQWRWRNEAGVEEFSATTQQAMLVYTDYKAMAQEEAATGRPSRPIDVAKRVLIVTVLAHPISEAWAAKHASNELSGDNADDEEAEKPKRGRGRPRKSESSGEGGAQSKRVGNLTEEETVVYRRRQEEHRQENEARAARGEPPLPVPDDIHQMIEKAAADPAPKRRGRGRPPKPTAGSGQLGLEPSE